MVLVVLSSITGMVMPSDRVSIPTYLRRFLVHADLSSYVYADIGLALELTRAATRIYRSTGSGSGSRDSLTEKLPKKHHTVPYHTIPSHQCAGG